MSATKCMSAQNSRYSSSLFLASSPAVLTGLRGLVGSFSTASAPTIACLTPFGGPTFMVLNVASHSFPLSSLLSSLSSSLALLSVSFLSGTLPIFLRPPVPPVQHDSFCLWHPTHTLRSSPPLVWEKHSMPFVRHWSHRNILASADMIIPAHFGTRVHLVLGILPFILVAWSHGGAGALLASLSSLISLSLSSSAVVSSS